MCFLGHLVLLLCILTISNVLHSQNPLILLPHLPHLMLFLLFQPMTLTLISQTKWKLSHGNFSISLVYNHENFCLNLVFFFFSFPLVQWPVFQLKQISPSLLFMPLCSVFLGNILFLISLHPGVSDSKESACDAGEPGSIPGSGRSPGDRNGNPLWYSCLGNPMNRGPWQATVCGFTKNWTQLSD